jgi:hypothetical protein
MPGEIPMGAISHAPRFIFQAFTVVVFISLFIFQSEILEAQKKQESLLKTMCP